MMELGVSECWLPVIMLPTPNSGNGAGLYDDASLAPFVERSGFVPISQAPVCMSEYEYCEFPAIDKSLDDGALFALRALSSRARITRANDPSLFIISATRINAKWIS